jgi:hypothetical protein
MDEYGDSKHKRGKLIHIRLTPKTHQRLRVKVAALGTTMQRWVSLTLVNALRPRKAKAIGAGGPESKPNSPFEGRSP